FHHGSLRRRSQSLQCLCLQHEGGSECSAHKNLEYYCHGRADKSSVGLQLVTPMRKKNQGVTLVEVMTVVAIIGLLLFVPRLLIQIERSLILNSTRNQLQREAEGVLTTVIHLLHQAKSSDIVISQDKASDPVLSR